MALKNYPATTESIALLQNLGEKMNVPMQIYTHHVSSAEEKASLWYVRGTPSGQMNASSCGS